CYFLEALFRCRLRAHFMGRLPRGEVRGLITSSSPGLACRASLSSGGRLALRPPPLASRRRAQVIFSISTSASVWRLARVQPHFPHSMTVTEPPDRRRRALLRAAPHSGHLRRSGALPRRSC